MKPLEKTANDLFQHLRTRFSPITIGDENAEVTTDPMAARFFSFVYEENGEARGPVSISIINNRSLKIYFSHDMVESITNSNDWYRFLKEMRFFAKQNLMSFDARDIQKDQLDTRDFNFIKQNDGPYKDGDVEITESAMYGSKRKSMQKFENATLVVYHKRTVDEEKRGSRSRHIDSIFIESNHERFRFPINYLNGARAMAVHVSEGGTPYDAIGQHIINTVSEMQNLAKFARMTKRHAMEDSEAATIRDRVVETYHAIKKDIMRMQNVNNYRTFAETFEPTEASGEADVSSLQEKFTRKVWNEQMTDLLPSVQRALEAKVDEAEVDASDPKSIIRQRTIELARKIGVSMKNVNLDKVYNYIEQRKSLGKGPVNQQPEKIQKLIDYYQNMAFKARPDYSTQAMDEIFDRVVAMVDEVAPMIHATNEADIDENAFNQAAADAARAGKKEFKFNGKTYPVKMDKDTAHKLDEAYVKTAKDAIETLGNLRKIGKKIETGQDTFDGNLANMYANDVYDVISWVENNLDTSGADYQKVIGPVIELRKKAKSMEREPGSGKNARFGNEIVNTLYPLMQWIEMNQTSALEEASPSVEKTIKDPNFVLVLKKDDDADNMIRRTKFTRADGLLSFIMSDIASRMIGDGADAVANFASEMSINIGDEGSSFGTKITPEYKSDKQLAMMLAKKYLDDIKQMATDPEYAATVRKDPKDVYGAKKKREGGTHESVELAFESWANEIFEATVGTVGTTGTKSASTNPMVVKALSGGDPNKAREIKRVSDKLARGQKLSPAEMPVAGEIAKSVMTTKKPTAAMQALAQDEYTDMDEAWGKEGENRMFMGAAGQPYNDEDDYEEENPVKDAIIHRLSVRYGMADLLKKYGLDRVEAAIDDVAGFHTDIEELGSSDISIMVKQVMDNLAATEESVVVEKTLRVKADKDYDGDGKIESPRDEYMGSKDKAVKSSIKKKHNEDELLDDNDTDLVRESLALLKRYAGL